MKRQWEIIEFPMSLALWRKVCPTGDVVFEIYCQKCGAEAGREQQRKYPDLSPSCCLISCQYKGAWVIQFTEVNPTSPPCKTGQKMPSNGVGLGEGAWKKKTDLFFCFSVCHIIMECKFPQRKCVLLLITADSLGLASSGVSQVFSKMC